MHPTAGSLSVFIPDAATILTAVGAVGVCALSVVLAINAYTILSEHFYEIGYARGRGSAAYVPDSYYDSCSYRDERSYREILESDGQVWTAAHQAVQDEQDAAGAASRVALQKKYNFKRH